jgi:hypothetical protein
VCLVKSLWRFSSEGLGPIGQKWENNLREEIALTLLCLTVCCASFLALLFSLSGEVLPFRYQGVDTSIKNISGEFWAENWIMDYENF